MEWKQIGAIFAFLLLAMPTAVFADGNTSPSNQPPVVNGISGPTSLNVDEAGTWSITATDPENGQLTYTINWGEQSTTQPTQLKSSGQAVTFQHSYPAAGTYTVSITVTDSAGASVQSTITVNVQSAPQPICTGFTQIYVGQAISSNGYSARLSDIFLSGSHPALVDILNSNGAVMSQLQVEPGTSSTFTASNGDRVDVYVCATQPGFSLTAKYAYVKMTITPAAQATCTDTDGGINYFKKGTVAFTTGSLGGSATDICGANGELDEFYCNGNSQAMIETTCQYGCSDGACKPQPSNQPPVITSGSGPVSLEVNQVGTWSISAYDPDGTELSYNVVWGDEYLRGMQAPSTFSSTATFQHTYASAGTYTITFTVKDASGATAQSTSTIVVGTSTAVKVDIKANGADNPGAVKYKDTFIVSWTSNAEGCVPYGHHVLLPNGSLWTSFNSLPATGSMKLLAAHQLGYVSELQVGVQCHIGSASAADSVTVPVTQGTNTNQPPVITATSFPEELGVNEVGTWKISAYDPDGTSLYYSVNWGDSQPNVKSSDVSSTATLQHSYSSAGTYSISFTVYDGSGMSTTEKAKVKVKDSTTPGTNEVTVAAGVSPESVQVGESFQVYGKVSYSSSIANSNSGEKKFMVVTRYLESNANLAKKSGTVSLASEDSLPTATSVAVEASSRQDGASNGYSEKQTQTKTDYIKLSPGETEKISAYFTATKPGRHKIVVEVYDMSQGTCTGEVCADNERLALAAKTTTSILVNEKPPNPPSEHKLTLSNGWNMISVPSQNSVQLSDIASKCSVASNAWLYDAGANSYQQATYLKSGYGYWLRAYSDCEYDIPSPYIQSISTKLSAGWNLVGAPASAIAASDFIGDCKVTSGPWYYAPSAGEYGYASTLKPGQAYWFKVSSACTMGTAGNAQPPAPPSS